MLNVQVRGAAAKIDAVFRFDKAAWSAVRRGVKEATEAVTEDARKRVPPMGLVSLSGNPGWGPWIHARDRRDFGYNRGAFQFSTRFRSKLSKGFREVRGQSILDTSNPMVAIFTLAGSVDQSRHPFNTALNRQTGTRKGARGVGMWPRLLTPAWHEKGPEAEKTIARLVEDAVAQLNRS